MTYLNLIYRFGTNAVSASKIEKNNLAKLKKVKETLANKPRIPIVRPFIAGTAGLGTSFFAIINLMKLKGVNFLDNPTLYFQNLGALINPSVPEAVKPDDSFFQFLQNLLNSKPPAIPANLTRGFPEMQAALDGMTKPQLIELFESKEKLLAFFNNNGITIDPATIDTLMNSQEYKDYLASLKSVEADVSFDITNIGGIALGVIAGVVSITLFYKMSKYLLQNPNKKIFKEVEKIVESFTISKAAIEEQINITIKTKPLQNEKLNNQIRELQTMQNEIKDLRTSLSKMKSSTMDKVKDKASRFFKQDKIQEWIQSKKEDLIDRLDNIIGGKQQSPSNEKSLADLIREVTTMIDGNDPQVTPIATLNLTSSQEVSGQSSQINVPPTMIDQK